MPRMDWRRPAESGGGGERHKRFGCREEVEFGGRFGCGFLFGDSGNRGIYPSYGRLGFLEGYFALTEEGALGRKLFFFAFQ
jgi:hypothetical protein